MYNAWQKKHTYYALTNKRVLVLNLGPTRKLVSGYLSALDSVGLTIRRDGIGIIEFSPEPISNSSLFSLSSRRRNRGPQLGINLLRLAFFDIPEVQSVYQLIESEREKARHREPIS